MPDHPYQGCLRVLNGFAGQRTIMIKLLVVSAVALGYAPRRTRDDIAGTQAAERRDVDGDVDVATIRHVADGFRWRSHLSMTR